MRGRGIARHFCPFTKRILMGALGAFLLGALAGCGAGSGMGELLSPNETYEKAGESVTDTHLRDKDSLYQEEEDVVTFYLTVGMGNKEDGTDHTWSQVNANSRDFYDSQGIEPYSCEALLQAGDEIGPISGQLGYGETTANASVRRRGGGSSRQVQKSYRITLKEGKGKWNGQKAIILNKYVTDPVRFTDKLAFDLMKSIPQMVSARTRFVHLYVKDRTEGQDGPFVDYGLYTQVEAINKTYFKNRDLDKNGSLYQAEAFDWQRHSDILKSATDADYDKQAFESLLEIQGEEDHTKLLALLDAVGDETQPVGRLFRPPSGRITCITGWPFTCL